jgi:hypothetical protein
MNPAAKQPSGGLVNHRPPVSKACERIVTVARRPTGPGKSGVVCWPLRRSALRRLQQTALMPCYRPQISASTGAAHRFAAAATLDGAAMRRGARDMPLAGCHVCVGSVQHRGGAVTPRISAAAQQPAACVCRHAPESPALVRSHPARRCGRPASQPPRRRCTRRRRCCE